MQGRETLRIALTSDLHEDHCSEGVLRTCFSDIKLEYPDILLILGDYGDGKYRKGCISVEKSLKLLRDTVGWELPVVSTLGNHDYWVSSRHEDHTIDFHSTRTFRNVNPSWVSWSTNYERIKEAFKEFKVHFLDEDGPFRLPGWEDTVFVGHTGWYIHSAPPTDDHTYLPLFIESAPAMNYMEYKARKNVTEWLGKVGPDFGDKTVFFCSHFPVLDFTSEMDFLMGWDPRLGQHIQEQFGANAVFCQGHRHKVSHGPLYYECGSGYGHPQYIMICE